MNLFFATYPNATRAFKEAKGVCRSKKEPIFFTASFLSPYRAITAAPVPGTYLWKSVYI